MTLPLQCQNTLLVCYRGDSKNRSYSSDCIKKVNFLRSVFMHMMGRSLWQISLKLDLENIAIHHFAYSIEINPSILNFNLLCYDIIFLPYFLPLRSLVAKKCEVTSKWREVKFFSTERWNNCICLICMVLFYFFIFTYNPYDDLWSRYFHII